MEKMCGLLVFLTVYQFAGMFHLHDAPIIERPQLVKACNAVGSTIGVTRLCRK